MGTLAATEPRVMPSKSLPAHAALTHLITAPGSEDLELLTHPSKSGLTATSNCPHITLFKPQCHNSWCFSHQLQKNTPLTFMTMKRNSELQLEHL